METINNTNTTTNNNTTNVNDILNPLFETAKGFCVVPDSDGTPCRDRTVIWLIECVMELACGISLPDLNPITTAVCHYARTAPDGADIDGAVKSLNDMQGLVAHLRANLCTIGIFGNALDRYYETAICGKGVTE